MEDGPVAFSEDEEEDQREASAESDGDYATIPPQPVARASETAQESSASRVVHPFLIG